MKKKAVEGNRKRRATQIEALLQAQAQVNVKIKKIIKKKNKS